jgi:hypothetical protein
MGVLVRFLAYLLAIMYRPMLAKAYPMYVSNMAVLWNLTHCSSPTYRYIRPVTAINQELII